MEKLIDVLKSTYLFEDIDQKYLEEIAKISTVKNYLAEEIIIKEDAVDSYNLYVLLQGKIEVYANTIGRKDQSFSEEDVITYSIQNKKYFRCPRKI